MRFPQLLRSMDHIGFERGGGDRDRDSRAKLYQSLVWTGGSTEQLQNMFPSLTRSKTPDNNVRRNTISASDSSNGRESAYRESTYRESTYEDDSRRNSYGNRNGSNDDYRRSQVSSSSSYRDTPSEPDYDHDNGSYRDRNRQSHSARHPSSFIVQESFPQVRGHSNDVLRSTFGRRVESHDDSHTSSRSNYRESHSADPQGLLRRASTGKLNNGRDGKRIIRRFEV